MLPIYHQDVLASNICRVNSSLCCIMQQARGCLAADIHLASPPLPTCFLFYMFSRATFHVTGPHPAVRSTSYDETLGPSSRACFVSRARMWQTELTDDVRQGRACARGFARDEGCRWFRASERGLTRRWGKPCTGVGEARASRISSLRKAGLRVTYWFCGREHFFFGWISSGVKTAWEGFKGFILVDSRSEMFSIATRRPAFSSLREISCENMNLRKRALIRCKQHSQRETSRDTRAEK